MASFIDSVPTWDDLYTQGKAAVRALRATVSFKPGSKADIEVRTQATLHHGAHMNILALLNNLIPTKSSGIFLDSWLWLFGLPDGDRDSPGYGRIKARGSIASDALTVTATGATADLNGEQFTDENGQTYQLNESYAFTGAGTYDFDVLAVDTGTGTNLKYLDSPTLEWVSTPANVSANPVLIADLENGVNEETDIEGRARLADLLQEPGLSGTPQQWRRVIEETSPGTFDGFVFSKRTTAPSGWGTTDYTAMLRNETGSEKSISAAQVILIDAAIEAELPTTLYRNSRQIYLTMEAKDIQLTLEMAPGTDESNLCDWDAESLKTTVSSSNEGSKWVDCAADINTVLTSGDRVIINGVEATVDVVAVGADNSKFSITTWPWGTGNTPTVGHYVTSGGGVISKVWQDVTEYLDTIAPCATYSSVRYLSSPALADDKIRVKWLQKAALNADENILDIHDIDISGSSSDVGPTEIDPTSTPYVNRLTQDDLAIWEQK